VLLDKVKKSKARKKERKKYRLPNTGKTKQHDKLAQYKKICVEKNWLSPKIDGHT
jgi:hypothetical protein